MSQSIYTIANESSQSSGSIDATAMELAQAILANITNADEVRY